MPLRTDSEARASPPVSVIVASRGRPQALSLCLTALQQVQYQPFEVVVVADPAGCKAVRCHAAATRVKLVEFDVPNLSEARNRGLSVAAAGIVAFLDDDAIPEPHWLAHLVEPFSDPSVGAAGGFVIGRNGISLQWGARRVDRHGFHTPVSLDSDRSVKLAPTSGLAVRTEGANCAFRRKILECSGGFDPAFRFYMDDTDLNRRLTMLGTVTAIVPRARVHHRMAASDRRAGTRAPRSLFEIGASISVFLRKHATSDEQGSALAAHRAAERRRLLRHMVAGTCTPEDVGRLLRTFDDGVAEGRLRSPGSPWRDATRPAFRAFRDEPRQLPVRRVSGWIWEHRRLAREARAAVDDGYPVHLLRLSPTALYHRLRFERPGVWVQTGGLFGRSDRYGRVFSPATLKSRLEAEAGRLVPPITDSDS